MSSLKNLCLTAALTALAAPAWAALTYTASGSYNIGASSGPGGTAAPSSACGNISGQDAGNFTGAGSNNIGLRAYSCDDSLSNFGSRASGKGTYFVQGVASISGTMTTQEQGDFSFFINPGQVGAFGSTAFGASEFQLGKLSIKLVIDGIVYMDEAWSAEIGEGGLLTKSYESHGLRTVDWTSTGGDGYFSYGFDGGFYSIALGAGDHDISYVMTSEAAGNITTTTNCTGVIYGEGHAAVVNATPGSPFPAYCGAGGQSEDPFADPIADPLPPSELPEPMSAGLALTALLAAAGVRRRPGKR